MKITKEVLKIMIAEEFGNMQAEVTPARDQSTATKSGDGFQQPQSGAGNAVTRLKAIMKKVSMDSSAFKGVDNAEAEELLTLWNDLLDLAQNSVVTPLLKQLIKIEQR
jgi:hypothetical protein